MALRPHSSSRASPRTYNRHRVPLGRWVAFTTNKDGNYEIYMKNTVSAEVVRLTNNGVADTRPAWYAWWHN